MKPQGVGGIESLGAFTRDRRGAHLFINALKKSFDIEIFSGELIGRGEYD